jgi:hypothetical protein
VGHRFVLVLSVQPGRNPMIECEGVPCEPSVGKERRRDAFEGAAAVSPGRQVQEGSEGAVDQRRLLVERELAHVAFAQLEPHTRLGGTSARLFEHRRRRVDSDD